VLRALDLGVLATWAQTRHEGLRGLLLAFDATWYGSIVEHGYDRAVPIDGNGIPEPTNLAFFPLYPAVTAVIRSLPFVGTGTALLLVAGLAALGAAAALYALGAHLRDQGTGILLVALWALAPHSLVESMGYSESLFTALAATALLAVLRRRWLTAGALTVLAGLTRPTAAALIGAVAIAAVAAIRHDWRSWRAWCALALAPLGLLGYFAWVAIRLGRADGYFYVQNQAWHLRFDGGWYTLRSFASSILHSSAIGGSAPIEFAEVSFALAGAVGLILAAYRSRIPSPLLVYAVLCVIIALAGEGFYWSKARMLLAAFPLLLPLAYWSRRSRWRMVITLTVAAALSATTTIYLALYWGHSF